MRGLSFFLGLPATALLFTAFSMFLACESSAAPFRFARRNARPIWLAVVAALGFASVPDLWIHGANAPGSSMFLAGMFTVSTAIYLLFSRRALHPREWENYPPAPVPSGQIRGFLTVDSKLPNFSTVRGRRWLGLARRIERWEYSIAPNSHIPEAIVQAQRACDESQTYSIFEVDIEAEVSGRGRFGPQGAYCRRATITCFHRVLRGTSQTPGSFLRRVFGLPQAPPSSRSS